MVDSIVKEATFNALFETSGLYLAAIIETKASLIKQDYSNYKDVKLIYKNISKKRVEVIGFKWYGVNAFNELADLGSYTAERFGGGFALPIGMF